MVRMFRFLLLLVFFSPLPASAATWYVDVSVASSGDGTSWETAFKTIQQGIDAASHGDTVVVAEGLYNQSIRFFGKNITLISTEPLDPGVVAETIIDGVGSVVRFGGTEDETCVLSGFTIRKGSPGIIGSGQGRNTHATIENNVITNNGEYFGAGVVSCDGPIRNNQITRNLAAYDGGGLFACHGLIENNIISENMAGFGIVNGIEGYGGGLYGCDGTIRNNIIVGNVVHDALGGPEPYHYPGQGAGLYGCDGIIEGNIVYGNHAYGEGGGFYNCLGTIRNCVIWGNTAWDEDQLVASTTPAYSCIQAWHGGGEGNISAEPRFVDAGNGDFWLRADSPCIDAGFNDPELPEFDIAGMPRIMFGGKSLTVDMGAYEFFYTGLQKGPGPDEATLVWSFIPDRTYSIFYTDDLFNWHTAIANFPSLGNETTYWTDDGSLTCIPPLLAPKRFYRLLENP
jgi:hypothetical protein